jgi:acyl-CoA oxidase
VIAEGDILTLCIRLFSELLLGRYQIRLPNANESILAKHALSYLEENTQLLRHLPDGHRSESFNALILPRSELAIEAMGHALAYSAAVKANLPKPILDMYECGAVKQDPAWYSEDLGISSTTQRIREDKAVRSMLPRLETYIEDLGIGPYVSAPIISDNAWKQYLAALPVFRGNADPENYQENQDARYSECNQFQARL